MAKRINPIDIVDKVINNYTVMAYEGKDAKNKHFYTIMFNDAPSNTYEAQERSKVIKGKCKDLITEKLNNSKAKQAKKKKRYAFSKKSVENYQRVSDLKNRCVIAIDGSTRSTGYAIWKQGKLITGQIEIPEDMPTAKRINKMATDIVAIAGQNGCDTVFYESPLPDKFNPKVHETLCELMGVVCNRFLYSAEHFIRIRPSSWKAHHSFKGERTEQKKSSIIKAEAELKRKVSEDEADAYNMLTYCLDRLELKNV